MGNCFKGKSSDPEEGEVRTRPAFRGMAEKTEHKSDKSGKSKTRESKKSDKKEIIDLMDLPKGQPQTGGARPTFALPDPRGGQKEQKKRKPDMETGIVIQDEPPPPGTVTMGQPPQQTVKIDHILELPAKAVRGPPPLTPFPEPQKTNINATRASPPGGWESYYEGESSMSSTTTSGILSYVPLIGNVEEEDSESSVPKKHKKRHHRQKV